MLSPSFGCLGARCVSSMSKTHVFFVQRFEQSLFQTASAAAAPVSSSMPVAGLGRRLRHLLRLFRVALARDASDFPDVVAALRALEASVDADLPAWMPSERKRGRPQELRKGQDRFCKSLRNRLDYARRCRRKAEAKIRELQQARERDGSHRVTAAFVARIALSAPSASSRAFADAWSDVVGAASAICSRRSIGRVRDAFTYVVKDLYFSRLQEEARDAFAAAAALASSAASAPAARLPTAFEVAVSFAPQCWVGLLHFHDEASLRLRSSADVGGAASRVRTSKVMQHVLWADFGLGDVHHYVPTELHALENKKATVLVSLQLRI